MNDKLKEKMGISGAADPAAAAAVAEAKKPKTFEEWITEMKPALKEALPDVLPPERFARQILTLYKASPEIRKCTPQSVMGAAMQAAQLGLSIASGLGHAYLVPFNNKKWDPIGRKKETVKEAQLVIGYKGYIELAYRSGRVSHIDFGYVYKTDEFDYKYGTNEFLDHKPAGLEKDGESPVKYYVLVHLMNGKCKFLVRTYEQIIRHAKQYTNLYHKYDDDNNPPRYRAGDVDTYSTWYKNFNQMAVKTVANELFKTVQLTPDIALALAQDGSIKNFDERNVSRNMAEEIIDTTDYTTEDSDAPYVEDPAVTTRGGDPGPMEPPADRGAGF